jgi:type IV secretory pathway TraG/TraD family ATPase VirD4
MDRIKNFCRLLFRYDQFPSDPDARLNAWLYVMCGILGLFMLWVAYQNTMLYVFRKPTRFHKPEALRRLGIATMNALPSVMGDLGLSLRALCEGVAFIGATGAGKSTALYRMMVEALRFRVGCLWMTVKHDEPENAAKVMQKAGRDYKVFMSGQSKWNPLVYEMTRPGGDAYSLAQYFEQADEIMAGGKTGNEQSFWGTTRRQSMALTFGTVWIAYRRRATLDHAYDFLNSSPPTIEATKEPSFADREFSKTLGLAIENIQNPAEGRLVTEAANHFKVSLAGAGEKAWGATVMHASSLISPLLRGAMYDTVNTFEQNISPDDLLRGECIIMGNPVVDNPGYQLIQILFSRMAADAVLRRTVTDDMPVVCIVRDEYQLIAHPREDAKAQTIARQQGLASIMAFQSLSVLYENMQEPMRAKFQGPALLGNHNTKVFMANSDKATLDYFSELTGKTLRNLSGGSVNQQQQPDGSRVADGVNLSWHQQLLPKKLGTALTRLRTGGPENGYCVEAYVVAPNRKFAGETFKKVSIQQDIA